MGNSLRRDRLSKVNQDEEGVAYLDHFDDEQCRNPQLEHQQEELDLNVTANDGTRIDDANMDSGSIRNGRPQPHAASPNGRRIPNAIDRRWSGGTSHNQEQRRSPSPRPFGGIGSNEFRITEELRHRMQAMKLEVQELQRENVELRTAMRHLKSQLQTPPRRHSRSQTRSPPRRFPQLRTLPRRKRHHSSSDERYSTSDERYSSSEEDRGRKRKTFRRYKKTRDRENTPPIDGHTPFSSRIL
ncbi:hypothetical protein PIB30_095380 [Stylosanthes scabra]|uniref:Uncharacterized protein n=1 Tax=Stylosanthes scabra TaxID=79078 RepID=A0ABU6WVJ9_9FABA|nr:hypothetical protein [Stylosanthes scabra]